MTSWKIFSFLIILSLFVEAFFSMIEMAAISFNKLKLQYLVNKKNKSAIYLNDLFFYVLH